MIILLLLFLMIPKTEPVAVPVVPVVETVQTEPQFTSPSDVPETQTPIQTQAKSVKPLEQPLNSSQNTEHTPIEAPIEPVEPEPITEPTFPPGTCTTCSYKINVGDKPTAYELEQLRKYQEQDYQ